MLHNGQIEDVASAGTNARGKYIFWLEGKTALECFEQTVGHGNQLVVKGHHKDKDGNEILYHRCPVCGKKPGTYKPGTYKDQGI